MAGRTRGPVPVPVESSNRDVTQDVLDKLDTTEAPLQSSSDFSEVSQSVIKAALDRLASRSMVTYETNDSEQAILTPEAEAIVAEGSHEFKVWDAVKKAGKIPIKELPVCSQRCIRECTSGMLISGVECRRRRYRESWLWKRFQTEMGEEGWRFPNSSRR